VTNLRNKTVQRDIAPPSLEEVCHGVVLSLAVLASKGFVEMLLNTVDVGPALNLILFVVILYDVVGLDMFIHSFLFASFTLSL
jgi:hypothetical protein